MNFQDVSLEFCCGGKSQFPASTLPEIIFSGKSNVGKSSLINKLVNRKALARVSAKPGKTATINFYRLGSKARLVDLPGYGYAKVSFDEKKRWAQLVEGYFGDKRKFCLVVQIIDMRHPPSADDLNMLDYLSAYKFPFIVALTKSDKLNKTQRAARLESLERELERFPGVKCVPFSSVTAEGVEEIREYIGKMVENF